jgi:hypothetical protein
LSLLGITWVYLYTLTRIFTRDDGHDSKQIADRVSVDPTCARESAPHNAAAQSLSTTR